MGVNWGEEGYCTVCRFVLPLGDAGKLVRHTRAKGGPYGGREVCRGVTPGETTPTESAKSAFRVSAPKMRCPECRALLKIKPDLDDTEWAWLPRHNTAGVQCPGSFKRMRRNR